METMSLRKLALIAAFLCLSLGHPLKEKELGFPEDFIWAAATSAYQVEGGVIGTGRGPSIWDRYLALHPPAHNQTGDVACDTYHKYEEDAILMKKQGLKSYRFSISWSRIFPDGRVHRVNPEGVQYYHNLIDALLKQDITPVVTLYHWDLPLSLGDLGGWLTSEIVDWFGDYARFCYQEYGSKVKQWITINEPHTQSVYGYCSQVTVHAPGGFQQNCEWSMYLAGHNFLLAHGRAASIYKNEFQKEQQGKVGITLNTIWYEPRNETDREAADFLVQSAFGWFANAIFSEEGDYPAVMKANMERLRRKEGRETSRLPEFTQEQIKELRGSADFMGLNYYISMIGTKEKGLHEPRESPTVNSTWGRDVGIYMYADIHWKQMGTTWIRYHPEGLYHLLNFIRTHYNNVPVYITENGCMDSPGEGMDDVSRIFFIKGHLKAVQKAIAEDGCDVKGYFFWSLFDNFEWHAGFTERFGMYHVDFDTPERTRTPKASAHWYKRVIDNNAVVE
uniref:Cytosolic beta-glucosidase n=1 Tax=Steinernema glaseri TaxID=37863 RepID=A0A1I7ZVY1_9BILA